MVYGVRRFLDAFTQEGLGAPWWRGSWARSPHRRDLGATPSQGTPQKKSAQEGLGVGSCVPRPVFGFSARLRRPLRPARIYDIGGLQGSYLGAPFAGWRGPHS